MNDWEREQEEQSRRGAEAVDTAIVIFLLMCAAVGVALLQLVYDSWIRPWMS